jgi:AAA ATPase domain
MSTGKVVAFGVENYKSYLHHQSVRLRPITLLFGKNNAGKSALQRALLHAKHIADPPLDALLRPSPEWSALRNAHGLGGMPKYPDFLNTAATSPVFTFTFTIELPEVLERTLQISSNSVRCFCRMWFQLLEDDLYGEFSEDVLHTSWDITIGDDALIKNNCVNKASPILCDLIARSAEKAGHPKAAKAILALIGNFGTPGPTDNNATPSASLTRFNIAGIYDWLPRKPILPDPSVKIDPAHEPIAKEVDTILHSLTQHCEGSIEGFLNAYQYIAPLRSVPSGEWLTATAPVGDRGYWNALIASRELRQRVNEWLARLTGDPATAPSVVVNINHARLFTPEIVKTLESTLDGPARKAIEEFQKEHGERETVIASNVLDSLNTEDVVRSWIEALAEAARTGLRYEIRLRDPGAASTIPLDQAGVGLSQVIPVIVAGLAQRDCTLAVEQPELHLHPAMQADLSDFFIESAKSNGNRWLIETHSEHVLLRIIRRIRETKRGILPANAMPLSPEDVSICFVERAMDPDHDPLTGDPRPVSRVHHVELGEDGLPTRPWPGGFFEEGFREVMAW